MKLPLLLLAIFLDGVSEQSLKAARAVECYLMNNSRIIFVDFFIYPNFVLFAQLLASPVAQNYAPYSSYGTNARNVSIKSSEMQTALFTGLSSRLPATPPPESDVDAVEKN
jgi:hypothetical protein